MIDSHTVLADVIEKSRNEDSGFWEKSVNVKGVVYILACEWNGGVPFLTVDSTMGGCLEMSAQKIIELLDSAA